MKTRFVLAASAALAALAVAAPATASTHLVTSGTTDHWGAYFGDQFRSDRDVTLLPEQMAFPDRSQIKQVGTSNSSQYVLLADGTLWAWGQGMNGQLGNGARANSFDRPVQVKFPGSVRIAFIPTDAMPYDEALAVDTQGHAWAWGMNAGGEDCLGNTGSSDVPVPIISLPAPVTALAGADQHAVYDAAGRLYSCGQDTNGVLGDGKKGVNSTTPVRVLNLDGAQVTALTESQDNAGALLSNGIYYDWGANQWGQLGDGTTKYSAVPVPVSLPARVSQVTQGGSAPTNGQVLAMLTNGTLYAWGCDAVYQLGDHRTVSEPSPVPFSPPPGVIYTKLATGGDTSYAIDAFGRVWSWGGGNAGQIGNGVRATAKAALQMDSGASFISSTASDVAVAG